MKTKFLTVLCSLFFIAAICFGGVACTTTDPDDSTGDDLVAETPDEGENSDENNSDENNDGEENSAEDPDDDDEEEEPTYTAPRLRLSYSVKSLLAGTEVNLLDGVTVSDSYDTGLTAEVSDDGGFDNGTVGEYTVVYTVTNSHDLTATATRKYTVYKNIVIEAQQENDETNWVTLFGNNAGKYEAFTSSDFYTLTASKSYSASDLSGIFYNASSETIVVSIPGSEGSAAILNASGTVIEGRDGGNGRIMNAENPQEASGATSFEYNGSSYSVASNAGMYMQIPAGGFAIYLAHVNSSAYDEDGRGWFSRNVYYRYGAAVKIYCESNLGSERDTDAEYTVYTDQAPAVISALNVSIIKDKTYTDAELSELLINGVSYIDDNGTWETSDDITDGLPVTVGNATPALDISVAGNYVFALTVTDHNGNSYTFSRTAVVRSEYPEGMTIDIGGYWFELADGTLAVNPSSVSSNGEYACIIYTSDFTGTMYNAGYAYYFIVNAAGVIREVYSPYVDYSAYGQTWNNGTLLTLDSNGKLVIQDGSARCASNVLYYASALSEGEYLVLAPNDMSETVKFRTYLRAYFVSIANFGLGQTVTFWNISGIASSISSPASVSAAGISPLSADVTAAIAASAQKTLLCSEAILPE